jgi:hypothetical protein
LAVNGYIIGIGTKLRIGVRIPVGVRDVFASPKGPYWLWKPLRLLFNGYWSYFPAVKQLGFEVNHSPPSSVEVKNGAVPLFPNTPLCCGLVPVIQV